METFFLAVVLMTIAHFIGDFLLQSDYMALNKSKNTGVLALHIAVYLIPITLIGLFVPVSFLWLAVNYVGHFITDAISSRLSGYFWRQEKRHWFFVTIGADQMIHMLTLVVTYYYLCVGI